MASLSYFVILSSPCFGKVSAFRLPSINTDQIILHRHRQPAISACSIKKPRGNRKVRSNEDLCNDLREFVSAVELPEGHVPSLKELSQHGRQDLANIVRRRGYKLIKELLATSTKYDREESDIEEGLMDKQATPGGCGNEPIGQDDKVKDIANDNLWSSEASGTQNILKIVNGADIDHNKSLDSTSCMPIASSTSSSLQEKVAKFIQSGELDAIEDDGFGILNEIGAEEGKEIVQLQKIENKSSSLGRELSEKVFGRSDAPKKLNGSISPSKEVVLRASGFNTPRDDGLSIAGLLRSDCEEEMNDEIRKRENQIEVNHLKFMLHQKELELSRLKEQIEKEKLALSVLQTKAETEISKAQKLILEKDAELYAAEESLSGLKEVQIQYRGDCETVEVAGSFNGWHHRITMDPQPSSSILEDPTGSRKSRLWTTVLWLYPGIYEIKFVVDGHWRVDPKRELVTSGTIQNNILRVDR